MEETKITLEEVISNFKSQASQELDSLNAKYENELSSYKKKLTEIENKFTTLSTSDQKCQQIIQSIEKLKSSAQANLEEIKKVHTEIFVDPSQDEYSIFNDIKDSLKQITAIYDKVKDINKALFGYKKKILTSITQQEYNKINNPEDKEESDGKFYKITYETVQGEKDKLSILINEYKSFLKDDQESVAVREQKVNNEVTTLLQRIENLLPGATAAGLSESYDKAEKGARHNTKIWMGWFIVSIVALCGVGWFMFYNGLIIIDSNMTFFGAIIQLLRILCFEFPFIWLAWAANIKISQYTRLTEEYRHKWTMMRIFDGMRSVLKENNSEQALETIDNFYRSLLLSFSENPSATLDKQYNPDGPFSIINLIKGLGTKCEKNEVKDEEKDGSK